MDLRLSRDVEESFRLFQGRIIDEYEAMIDEFGFQVVDATLSIEEQQTQIRKIVEKELDLSHSNGLLKAPWRGFTDANGIAANLL